MKFNKINLGYTIYIGDKEYIPIDIFNDKGHQRCEFRKFLTDRRFTKKK